MENICQDLIQRTLFTSSSDDLLESLSEILSCGVNQILEGVSKLTIKPNDSPDDVDLIAFFKCIGLSINNKEQLFQQIAFDSIILSHLSSRISIPKQLPLLNLRDALTRTSDISTLFLKYGVRFEVTNRHKILTFFHDSEVNWDNYSSFRIYRIKNRLLGNKKYQDNCINGFLFNDRIWEDSRVTHLYNFPEILSDISDVLGLHQLVSEWQESAKPYCIGARVYIGDVIYDGKNIFTKKSKIYFTYKNSLHYLKMIKENTWSPRSNNPMIRLKDNLNIDSKDVIGFYEIEK